MKLSIQTTIVTLLVFSCSGGSSKGDRGPDSPGGGNVTTIGMTSSPTFKTILPVVFGYNTQSIKGPGWDKSEFLSAIDGLNPGNFRYPGGTVGNFWDWKTGYYNSIGQAVQVITPGSEGPLPYKIEDVKKVYDRTGAEPVYMLNMLTATCDDQIAMLKHAQNSGLPVQWIEMGNEYYLDDHPESYNYLTRFPNTTDYTDSCRIWSAKIKAEFPDSRIALIGVNHPSSWTGRLRAREWNGIVMQNIQDVQFEAMTIHIYAKNALDSPQPYDMIGQVLNHTEQSRVLDASIPAQYPLWITEYNFEGGSNPFPGQWIHGLAATIMTAQLVSTPRVEMVCFFNLTAGLTASAIYDNSYTIHGQTAPKYALSASGEALKMFSKAQKNATSVASITFSENPKVPTQKNGNINTLYGYKFDGVGTKVLVINIGSTQVHVATDALGFAPSSFEQVSAVSLETPIIGASSLSRLNLNTDPSKNYITLRPYSITIIK